MSESKHGANSNTDILGDTWFLAPGGHRRLERAKNALWDLQHEMLAFSALFSSLGPDTVMDQAALHGLGITMKKVSRRLQRIHEQLEHAEKHCKNSASKYGLD